MSFEIEGNHEVDESWLEWRCLFSCSSRSTLTIAKPEASSCFSGSPMFSPAPTDLPDHHLLL
jgi:hypothetical protein